MRGRTPAEHGIDNVEFREGTIYQLDVPDASIDVCTLFAMMETLDDPLAGLAEVRRILKPGGLVAASSIEYGGLILHGPDEPLLRRFYELRLQSGTAQGDVHSYRGRELRGLLSRPGSRTSKRPSVRSATGPRNAYGRSGWGVPRTAGTSGTWTDSRSTGLADQAEIERWSRPGSVGRVARTRSQPSRGAERPHAGPEASAHRAIAFRLRRTPAIPEDQAASRSAPGGNRPSSSRIVMPCANAHAARAGRDRRPRRSRPARPSTPRDPRGAAPSAAARRSRAGTGAGGRAPTDGRREPSSASARAATSFSNVTPIAPCNATHLAEGLGHQQRLELLLRLDVLVQGRRPDPHRLGEASHREALGSLALEDAPAGRDDLARPAARRSGASITSRRSCGELGDPSRERLVHRAEALRRSTVPELLPEQRHKDPAEALALGEPHPAGSGLVDLEAVLSVEDARHEQVSEPPELAPRLAASTVGCIVIPRSSTGSSRTSSLAPGAQLAIDLRDERVPLSERRQVRRGPPRPPRASLELDLAS